MRGERAVILSEAKEPKLKWVDNPFMYENENRHQDIGGGSAFRAEVQSLHHQAAGLIAPSVCPPVRPSA